MVASGQSSSMCLKCSLLPDSINKTCWWCVLSSVKVKPCNGCHYRPSNDAISQQLQSIKKCNIYIINKYKQLSSFTHCGQWIALGMHGSAFLVEKQRPLRKPLIEEPQSLSELIKWGRWGLESWTARLQRHIPALHLKYFTESWNSGYHEYWSWRTVSKKKKRTVSFYTPHLHTPLCHF